VAYIVTLFRLMRTRLGILLYVFHFCSRFYPSLRLLRRQWIIRFFLFFISASYLFTPLVFQVISLRDSAAISRENVIRPRSVLSELLSFEKIGGDIDRFFMEKNDLLGEGLVFLNYHNISPEIFDPTSDSLTVTPSQFASHMAFLKRAGFESLSSRQVRDHFLYGKSLPSRAVVITFDDGPRGVWEYADPILERYDYHGIVFVITGKVAANPHFLTWEELELLSATGRWDLESHSHLGDQRIPINSDGEKAPFFISLAWLPESRRQETFLEFQDRVTRDLERSISVLSERGFPDPVLFAYPLSAAVSEDERLAAFYKKAVQSIFHLGVINELPARPISQGEVLDRTLHRVPIYGKTDLAVLRDHLQESLIFPLETFPSPVMEALLSSRDQSTFSLAGVVSLSRMSRGTLAVGLSVFLLLGIGSAIGRKTEEEEVERRTADSSSFSSSFSFGQTEGSLRGKVEVAKDPEMQDPPTGGAGERGSEKEIVGWWGIPNLSLFVDRFDSSPGLLTNQYAYWHPSDPAAVFSSVWMVVNGTLYSRDGNAWSGVPDGIVPDSLSGNGSGSAIFRMVSRRKDFENVIVRFSYFIHGQTSTPRTPPVPWDGLHIWVRHQSLYHSYIVSVGRRDNFAVIKKKMPGGPSNGGTYYTLGESPLGMEPGMWHTVALYVENCRDGVVRLVLARDGKEVLRTSDTGAVSPAIGEPGSVGIRGDNTEFSLDDFVVGQWPPTC